MNNTNNPPIRAVHMPLFPSMGTIQEVIDFGKSKLPIKNENELVSLLMVMQNTVLNTR